MNNYRDYYNYENNNYNLPLYEQKDIKVFDPYEGFIRGNMFNDLYNTYRFDKPININPKNEQAKLLTTIDSLTFSLIDLDLYLDIHSNDVDVLKLYNYYKNSLNEYIKEYESKYGPLSIDGEMPNDYFTWVLSPWPFEGDNNV